MSQGQWARPAGGASFLVGGHPGRSAFATFAVSVGGVSTVAALTSSPGVASIPCYAFSSCLREIY
eukprot:5868091-Pyramimonas_sp.AAC.1